MSDVTHEPKAFRSYALKVADSVYSLSFYSVAAYSLALFLAGAVTMAVACNIVEVPEFHPR